MFNPQPKPEKKKKSKCTGELNVFREIWIEREHLCEECGLWIRDFSPANFHHVIPKGKDPSLRLDKTNISLLCFDCHQQKHFGTKKAPQ